MEKTVDNEHWDVKAGDLAGLWSIDATKAMGSDMWAKIEDVISSYTRLHPLEIELTVRQNGEINKTIFNDLATNQTGTMRWGVDIPAGLMFKIQSIYPEVFTNKDLLHKFMKKYKGFTVCSRV